MNMVAEALNMLVRKAATVGERKVEVSILQYADDTILVCLGKKENIRVMKGILRIFEYIYGLKVNFQKSKLYGMFLKQDFIREAESLAQCRIAPLPISYLEVTGFGEVRESRSNKFSNLIKRGLLEPTNGNCTFCWKKMETEPHIFLHCDVARQFWERILEWLGIHTVLPNHIGTHFLQFTNLLDDDNKGNLGTTIWIGIVWSIWNLRNDYIFKGNSPKVDRTVENLKIQLWFWVKSHIREKNGISFSRWLGDPCNRTR
ncbi:hypothetical protein ACS0TY_034659 [Phlomoides rotata]